MGDDVNSESGRRAAEIAPDTGPTRIPYSVYQDPALYDLELKRIFGGPVWSYVALDAEIPQPGDYKRTFVGEKSVLVLRDSDNRIGVVENRCAHRGARICQDLLGNAGNGLMCPYHQWTYDLKGNLTGVPFRRGVKGRGGMPDKFRLEDHGLPRLRVATLNGVVFASFSAEAPPLEEYLGPEMTYYLTRIFDGRRLRILGYQRQSIDSNWKVQMENLKDPYHAGLLHMFLVSFGLFRIDQDASKLLMDESKGHSVAISRRVEHEDHSGTEDVVKYTPDYQLEDPTLISTRKEFPDDVTLSIQTVFPNLIVQAQSNTLATRQVLPKGVGAHELVYTFFGYEDDDEELLALRMRQANFVGAAGLITLDDHEALQIAQLGINGASSNDQAVLDLGLRDAEPGDHMITESTLRGFHHFYRKTMGML